MIPPSPRPFDLWLSVNFHRKNMLKPQSPKINRPGIESIESNIDDKIGKKKNLTVWNFTLNETPAFKSKQKAKGRKF